MDHAYALLEHPGGDRFDGSGNSSLSTDFTLYNIFLFGDRTASITNCFYYLYQAPSHESAKNAGYVISLCQCGGLLLSGIAKPGIL